jgi:hypothetical protein
MSEIAMAFRKGDDTPVLHNFLAIVDGGPAP